MPRDGSGVYSKASASFVNGTTIASAAVNADLDDIVTDLNAARPITAGGTGGTSVITGFDGLMTAGSSVASATTVVLNSVTGPLIDITGTTTITAITLGAGKLRLARAAGAFQLTASASLIVNGSTSTNYTTTAEDFLLIEGYSGSVTRVWTLSSTTGASVVTLTGSQTLTNKTLTTPALTLKQSTTPTPTAEGDIQWDTDDNVLVVGDGAATRIFLPIPASTAAGDIEYYTGAKVKARLAKGSDTNVLTLASGVPTWAAPAAGGQPIPSSSTYAVGDSCFAVSTSGTVSDGSTTSGSNLTSFNISYQGSSGASPVTVGGGGALTGTWKNISGVTQSPSGSIGNNYVGRWVRTL